MLGLDADFLTTCDLFRGVALASKSVLSLALAHIEVASLKGASEAAIVMVVEHCRQLAMLKLASFLQKLE